DYRRNGRARFRTMTLKPNEFIRRFLLHVLPKGFHRIRHYGLLASATCKANIARARELIAAPLPSIDPSTEQDDPDVPAAAGSDDRPPCPCCGGRMIIVESFGPGGGPRAPPSPQAGSRDQHWPRRHERYCGIGIRLDRDTGPVFAASLATAPPTLRPALRRT